VGMAGACLRMNHRHCPAGGERVTHGSERSGPGRVSGRLAERAAIATHFSRRFERYGETPYSFL
jgi:hypothetical protein